MEISKAAKFAIANVRKEGLTDIFTPPFELELLRNELFQKKLTELTSKCIRGNSLESLEISQIEHVLLPKGGAFDFRRCALIQPLDTIKYIALALTIADDLEKLRPRKQRKIVFSYRLKPNKGYLFDPKYNITSFRKSVSEKIKQKSTNFLVSCDIANFYDRLNLHRLESILLSNGFEKIRVKQINQLLLFWANRDSYSLPVGSNASRIFAEAALLEVDNYLLSIGIKFCRFVDDYRLFAPNAHKAHYWLTELIERLWLEGLAINMRKTKIEDVSKKVPEKKETSKQSSTKTAEKKENEDSHDPQFKIIAGYGGIIPTRFRIPSETEILKLKDTNPDKLFIELKSKKLIEAEDIKYFVKSIVSTERFDQTKKFPELSDLFPQFTPYIIDVLIKYSDKIDPKIRTFISSKYSNKLKTRKYLPEYITIEIVKLLGCKEYQDKDTLISFFRELRRNSGAYIGRSLLDSLEDLISRNEVLEIRKYFPRADLWEKRQIIKIVDKHLDEEEKRPWLRNIKTQESRDPFVVEFISPLKAKKKKLNKYK